ncbi:MAG: TolC family protein [Gemmatimonadota bacterium]
MIWLLAGQLLVTAPAGAVQQDSAMTITQARALARNASAAIVSARADADATAARERQAGAYPNPLLSYGREKTGSSAQDIIAFDQPIELPGRRAARSEAARLRRRAAEARLTFALSELDAEVSRRAATLITGQTRVTITGGAAAHFARAAASMRERLASGDVSGYAARRVALEAARYAALSAEAESQRTTARAGLAELTQTAVTMVVLPVLLPLSMSADSVAARIAHQHPLVQAAKIEAEAAAADSRFARQLVFGTPVLSGGLKTERSSADGNRATGFVAGFTLPLPLWDRRSGAIAATDAEARRLAADAEHLQRQITREALALYEAVHRIDTQLETLKTALGTEAQAALRAAEAAYSEGEITLLEWLDAVRAYQEAESAYATVLGDAITQRALLERILGLRLIGH